MRKPQSDEQYRYHKLWSLERANGHLRIIDAGPMREHIESLLAKGWTYRGIADAAGASISSVHNVGTGKQTMAHRDTLKVVLALRPDDIFTRPLRTGYVPNVGARRRVRALMAIGWRHSDMDRMAGFATATLLHQVGDWISQVKHDSMKRVYDQLWDKPGPMGPSGRARIAKAGYLPPLAWDDHTIDDPDFILEAVDERPAVDARREDLIEDVELLVSTGARREEIAARLHANWDNIERSLQRYGRHDLVRATA